MAKEIILSYIPVHMVYRISINVMNKVIQADPMILAS